MATTAAPLPTAADAAVSRGRPRSFTDDEVLDALVQLFWQQGYEATSMNDIVTATGLSKSSLYNAFGSKDELFAKALNRYVDHRSSMMTQVLNNGTQGLDDIKMLFEALWAEISTGDDHRGCLAINTSTELGFRDDNVVAVGNRFRSTLRDGFEATLTRAADLGEVNPEHIEGHAAVLVSFMIGTAVIVRGGGSDDEVRGQLDAARAMVEGWRNPH